MKKLVLAAAVSFGLIASVSAMNHGEHKRMNPEEMFKKLDTNQDQKLSMDEVKAAKHPMIEKAFTQIDTNQDGFLTTDELKAHHEKMRGSMKDMKAKVNAADTNKDGKWSKDEVNQADLPMIKEHFDTIDTDKDGFLTKKELGAHKDQMKKQMKEHVKDQMKKGE